MNASTLFNMSGSRALVTGASGGIGLHFAELLASAGASVVLAARRVDRLQEAVIRLNEKGYTCAAVSLDVTDSSSISLAFDTSERQLGGPINVLINCAGVMSTSRFLDQQEVEISRIFATNFRGSFLVAQEAARRMVELGRGSIVNVASTAGLRNGGYLAAYGASKAALIHLTKTMALELASKGIRANVLAPGNIDTDMQAALDARGFREPMIKRTPLRRFGQLDDLDGPLLLLASDAGRYMTGACVTVDGGQTLSWM